VIGRRRNSRGWRVWSRGVPKDYTIDADRSMHEAASVPVPSFTRAASRVSQVLAFLVFVATFAVRIRGVTVHFSLLGDQMRDWAIAMRPFSELPLVGPATHVGGYTIGPGFYWILWAIRVTIGPLFDNLPHAGGIGQAAVQSAADAILFAAIWRRTGSPWAALTTVVLVATASFDLNLAALVWNPTMGSALAKIALALVLLDWHRASWIRAAAAAAVAWIAVHAYTGAIFVAVGVFAAFLIDPFLRNDRPMVWRNALVVGIVVLALQLPYIAYQLTRGFRDQAMGAVTGSVMRVVSGASRPEVAKSVAGYMSAVKNIQIAPWAVPGAGWVLVIGGAVVAIRHFKDPALLSVTLLPQLLAIAGYSLFLAGLDDYYYLSLMPAVVLTTVLAATAMPSRRVSHAVGAALLVGSLALVPGRLRREADLPHMPQYALLVDASRKIRSLGQPMRAIQTDFTLPPTADPEYLFALLGGQIDRRSPWLCVIRSDGRIDYRQVAAQ
jgi:hypothetical protein